jgi:hypothetical protein
MKVLKQIQIYVVCLIVLTTTQSCATLFTGTKDTVYIQSQPTGAKIEINGMEVGTTPTSLQLKRKDNPVILLKKEGYHNKMFSPTKAFNNVAIVNLGNLLGWVIDVSTGAINVYDKKTYDIKLDSIEKKQPIPIP